MPFKLFGGKKKTDPPTPKEKDKEDKRTSSVGQKGAAAAVVSPGAAVPPSPDPSAVAAAAPIEYQLKKRQFPRIETHLEIFYREVGCVMDRVAPGRRLQEVCCCFNPKTFLLTWYAGTTKGKPGTHIGQIDVSQVKEVRIGAAAENTKDFKAGIESAGDTRGKFALCILYGTEFKLKQLCFYMRREDEQEAWVESLYYHMPEHNPQFYDFPAALPRWLEKHWAALDRQGKQSIVSKDVRVWLGRINCKLSPKEIKDYFQMVDKLKQTFIGIEEFTELYHILVDVKELTDDFSKFASAKVSLSLQEFVQFMRTTQGEPNTTEEECRNIMQAYAGDGAFKISYFVEYLHSRANDIWNHAHDEIHMDMTQPLAHYFIASSHNTYLMGDQLRSESSVEAYIRALRSGCRCIEIDCWSERGQPEPTVYHGHTMTTKIKFRDVLMAIRDHAFDASEFPLILSIENHSNLQHQEVMAQLFQEMFGANLITGPLVPNATQYPSPLELLRRIIIKHKKLDSGATEIVTAHREDVSSSIKNGFLMVEDKIDHSWTRHYFVLTESHLSYMEAQEDEPEQLEEMAVSEEDKMQQSELHYGEPWFHGDLRPGATDPAEAREYAAQLVLANSKGDGTFLVRESRTHGGYALSFLYEGKVQHCRIRSANGRYFLTNEATFPNLFELVEYFKREPLRTVGYSMRLTEPVPQPAPHEDKRWYHRNLSRGEAEDWLKRIKSDGAFLVRASESAEKSYAISFKAEGKVKHCRIKKEGRMYCIGDAEFESLVKLVEYYEKHPLYRKMKLRYPVDEELLRMNETEEVEEDIYHCEELYQEPNAFEKQKAKAGTGLTITCKAVYAYTGKSPDELSFPKDAIITNVVKKDIDVGWWQGDYGGMVGGWLPCNYVEELKFDNMGKEEREGEENPLGLLQKAEMPVQYLEVKPRPSQKDMRLVFRIQSSQDAKSGIDVGVESEEEMKSWVSAIARAVEQHGKAKQEHGANVKKDLELQRKFGIHKDLSDLIFYSQSVSFPGFDKLNPRDYYKMSSFVEKKALFAQQMREFNDYHFRQLSRVYPSGRRVDSSNFDPQPMWNAGCQMAALNYQYNDKPLWLNHGKFRQNGGTGYLLKPEVQRRLGFDPGRVSEMKLEQMVLSIRVISARHLVKTRGIASPFVEVEVVGIDDDLNKYKTRTTQDNGLCPVWNEEFSFVVSMPELACVRFIVQDEDMFGDPNTIGQASFPLGSTSDPSLRTGYRSVPLRNEYDEPLELSSLLVFIDITIQTPSDEYQSLQSLRSEIRKQQQRRDDLVQELAKAGGLDPKRTEELMEVKTNVLEMEKKLMSNTALKNAKAKVGGKVGKK